MTLLLSSPRIEYLWDLHPHSFPNFQLTAVEGIDYTPRLRAAWHAKIKLCQVGTGFKGFKRLAFRRLMRANVCPGKPSLLRRAAIIVEERLRHLATSMEELSRGVCVAAVYRHERLGVHIPHVPTVGGACGLLRALPDSEHGHAAACAPAQVPLQQLHPCC